MESSNRYGYIRVSSKDQNEERQWIALLALGIPRAHIYVDKQSGKDFNRPAYRKLLRRLKKGDHLFVKSIDRLGRNYREIMEQWRLISKEKEVDITILDMPLLDTTKNKDLLGTFISDIVLQLLSFVAENEREAIRQRQAEGIAAAKARGVRWGKQEKPLPPDFDELYRQYRQKRLSATKLAERCGVHRSTLYIKLEKYETERLERVIAQASQPSCRSEAGAGWKCAPECGGAAADEKELPQNRERTSLRK